MVAVSAGNHAQGVAHHAIRLGIPVTVLMPTTAPLAKVANTARLGATVIQHGATVAESMERLGELAAAGLTLIHPYDDPLVIAGQGTVGLELFADHPDLETLVVPVGGGGLLAGLCVAAERLAPACELVGVQADRYPFAAVALGLAEPPSGALAGISVADGIAVKRPGRSRCRSSPGTAPSC